MRDFVRYFAWVVLGGGVLAAAVAQFAEPFFGELYKVLGIDTSKWVVPLLTFLRSGWGQNVIFASIGFGLGVLTHWVAKMLDRTVRQPPLMNNSVVPGKSARGQSPDSTKVQLVDQLYPLLYDLSERDVDQFGNRIGDWRDAFVNDLSKDWFAMFNAELRLLAGRFEEFRPMFSRHAFYVSA